MDDTWNGGFYEAAIVLGKTQSANADNRLTEALTALWSHPLLHLSERLNLTDLDNVGRLEGILDHPVLGPLVAGAVVVRERDMPNGNDWLYVVVPLGGLSEHVPEVDAWPVGDDGNSRSWREPLEACLAGIVLDVARIVPIKMATIGYEIAGVISDFDADKRHIGFVVRDARGELTYWPTTHWS